MRRCECFHASTYYFTEALQLGSESSATTACPIACMHNMWTATRIALDALSLFRSHAVSVCTHEFPVPIQPTKQQTTCTLNYFAARFFQLVPQFWMRSVAIAGVECGVSRELVRVIIETKWSVFVRENIIWIMRKTTAAQRARQWNFKIFLIREWRFSRGMEKSVRITVSTRRRWRGGGTQSNGFF